MGTLKGKNKGTTASNNPIHTSAAIPAPAPAPAPAPEPEPTPAPASASAPEPAPALEPASNPTVNSASPTSVSEPTPALTPALEPASNPTLNSASPTSVSSAVGPTTTITTAPSSTLNSNTVENTNSTAKQWFDILEFAIEKGDAVIFKKLLKPAGGAASINFINKDGYSILDILVIKAIKYFEDPSSNNPSILNMLGSIGHVHGVNIDHAKELINQNTNPNIEEQRDKLIKALDTYKAENFLSERQKISKAFQEFSEGVTSWWKMDDTIKELHDHINNGNYEKCTELINSINRQKFGELNKSYVVKAPYVGSNKKNAIEVAIEKGNKEIFKTIFKYANDSKFINTTLILEKMVAKVIDNIKNNPDSVYSSIEMLDIIMAVAGVDTTKAKELVSEVSIAKKGSNAELSLEDEDMLIDHLDHPDNYNVPTSLTKLKNNLLGNTPYKSSTVEYFVNLKGGAVDQLHQAINNNDPDFVKNLIKTWSPAVLKTATAVIGPDGKTAFELAVEKGDIYLFGTLLKYAGNAEFINAPNQHGKSLLEIVVGKVIDAINNNSNEAIGSSTLMLEAIMDFQGVDITKAKNLVNHSTISPSFKAVIIEHLESPEKFGAFNISETLSSLTSSVTRLASDAASSIDDFVFRTKAIDKLHEHINKGEIHEFTNLFNTALNGNEKYTFPTLRGASGKTALELAIDTRNLDIFKALFEIIKNDSKAVNAYNNEKNTILDTVLLKIIEDVNHPDVKALYDIVDVIMSGKSVFTEHAELLIQESEIFKSSDSEVIKAIDDLLNHINSSRAQAEAASVNTFINNVNESIYKIPETLSSLTSSVTRLASDAASSIDDFVFRTKAIDKLHEHINKGEIQKFIDQLNADWPELYKKSAIAINHGSNGKTALEVAVEKGDADIFRAIFEMIKNDPKAVNAHNSKMNTILDTVVLKIIEDVKNPNVKPLYDIVDIIMTGKSVFTKHAELLIQESQIFKSSDSDITSAIDDLLNHINSSRAQAEAASVNTFINNVSESIYGIPETLSSLTSSVTKLASDIPSSINEFIFRTKAIDKLHEHINKGEIQQFIYMINTDFWYNPYYAIAINHNSKGKTALEVAVEKGDISIFKTVFDIVRGYDHFINAKNDGNSILDTLVLKILKNINDQNVDNSQALYEMLDTIISTNKVDITHAVDIIKNSEIYNNSDQDIHKKVDDLLDHLNTNRAQVESSQNWQKIAGAAKETVADAWQHATYDNIKTQASNIQEWMGQKSFSAIQSFAKINGTADDLHKYINDGKDFAPLIKDWFTPLQKASITAIASDGKTALELAIEKGNIDTLKKLLQYTGDAINSKNDKDYSILDTVVAKIIEDIKDPSTHNPALMEMLDAVMNIKGVDTSHAHKLIDADFTTSDQAINQEVKTLLDHIDNPDLYP